MELLLSFITTLLLCVMFILISPCLSHPTTDLPLSSSSHEQVNHIKEEPSQTKVLSRKLRLMNDDSMVKSAAVTTNTIITTRDFKQAATAADTKPKKASPEGTKILHNHSIMDGRKGTRQNWIEQSNSWQYFTMDYAHVRRRRPIHNKSIHRAP